LPLAADIGRDLDRLRFWLDLKLILASFWITFRGAWERRDSKL
jgi:hypothetical protein